MQVGFSRTLQELTMKIEELEILRGLYLKLRGDGKRYQFRCRMGNDFDEVSYSHYLIAKNVDWQEKSVYLSEILFQLTVVGFLRVFNL